MYRTRIFVAVIAMLMISAFTLQAQNKFSGVKACAACHKAGKGGDAFVVWEKSAHSKAFETLKTDKAKEIAKSKGLKEAPHEAAACLKCHVTGGGTAKNVEASFKMEEGVGCESCHGAASGYKMIHAKGDKEKSKAAGMIAPDGAGKDCLSCHNSESPTFKEFKYKEAWAKIAHKLPVKK